MITDSWRLFPLLGNCPSHNPFSLLSLVEPNLRVKIWFAEADLILVCGCKCCCIFLVKYFGNYIRLEYTLTRYHANHIRVGTFNAFSLNLTPDHICVVSWTHNPICNRQTISRNNTTMLLWDAHTPTATYPDSKPLISYTGLLEVNGFQKEERALFDGLISGNNDYVTSIPACRDAPCNETKRRYFEFKRLKICERIKISIFFYFSCIIYIFRTLLTYQFRMFQPWYEPWPFVTNIFLFVGSLSYSRINLAALTYIPV